MHDVVQQARSALNAFLTHMGMDEDEWNKPTFDQAREAVKRCDAAIAASRQAATPAPAEPSWTAENVGDLLGLSFLLTREHLEQIAARLNLCGQSLAAPPATPAPAGWKLVPEEPTHEMNLAGLPKVCDIAGRGPHHFNATDAKVVYKAMLAAAPVATPAPAEPHAARYLWLRDHFDDVYAVDGEGNLVVSIKGYGVTGESAERLDKAIDAARGSAPQSLTIALNAATPATPAAQPADGWIAVADRLPEKETDVLVWSSRGLSVAGIFHGDWLAPDRPHRPLDVTHWRPLPAAPEGSQG